MMERESHILKYVNYINYGKIMKIQKDILVVVPAYNEEKYIGKTLEDLLNVVPKQNILVVNDASKDKTEDIVKQYGVNVITHQTNKGLGGALRTGFKYAIENGYSYVITFDADGQHKAEWIPKIIDKTLSNNCDFTYGIRKGEYPLIKLIGNIGLDILMMMFTGLKFFRDSQSGFRMISTKLLRNMNLQIDRYGISSELLIEAVRNNAKICTIDIEAIYIDPNKGTNIRSGFRIMKELISKYWI